MSSSFDNEAETPAVETLAKLAENIVWKLPGCSDLAIRKTLQEVYRDFCRRSCSLRGRRHFTLAAGQKYFSAIAVNGGMTDAVAEVKYNGRTLKAPRDYSVAAGETPVVFLAPRWVVQEGTATDALPEVELLTVEIPAIGSEDVPCGFVARHGETICSGALARLMAMTGKAWSDAAQAVDERLRYENAITEERVRYYAGDMAGAGRLEYAPDGSELI